MFLSNLLSRAADCWGGRQSLVLDERAFTWAQTDQRVRQLASALATIAAPHGRCVVVMGQIGIEYFELVYAVPRAGLIFVPMNTRLSDAELRELLAQIDVGAIVFGPSSADAVATLRKTLDVPAIGWGGAATSGAADYETLLREAAPAAPRVNDPGDPWTIVFTGGTTGLPKGVELSHAAIAFNMGAIFTELPFTENCRFLQVAPMFHVAGLQTIFLATQRGATIHFLPEFSPDGMLDALGRYRCSAVNMVPTMLAMMLNHPRCAEVDLSHLRDIVYGASAISLPTLQAALARFPGLTFTQVYGQTECCGSLTVLAPEHHSSDPALAHRLRSAGRPISGAMVLILDEDGDEVPRGVAGEICGWSPALFTRYLGYPDLTATTKRGGWLHTGDIGYMDADGFLYVSDRLKDMIVTGGENVSSSEVETVIAAYADVHQVAVVGAPDPIWGERVHAFIVTPDPASFDLEAMRGFCRTRVAGYKVPKTATVQSEGLPLSAVGKVRKDLLRASLIALEG